MVNAKALFSAFRFNDSFPLRAQSAADASEPLRVLGVSSSGGPKTGNAGVPVDRYRIHVGRVLDSAVIAAQRASMGPVVFDNLGMPHAEAVIQEMLLRAFRSVKIYAKRLNKKVYKIDLLRAFLARTPKGIIDLIVEDENVFADPDSALHSAGDLLQNPNVRVWFLPEQFRGDHFGLVDDVFLRIETCQDNKTASITVGPDLAVDNAIELFSLLVKNSRQLNLPTS